MFTLLRYIKHKVQTRPNALSRRPEFIELFEKIIPILPYNPGIIDAGAHIGTDSIAMANLFPEGKIYSFEPIPIVFKRLKKNANKYNNIICYPFALSNKDGISSIYVSKGSSDGSSSLLPPKEHLIAHPTVTFPSIIEVSTITIDSWKSENKIDKVDFLWLDLQGHELDVLKSAKETLKKVRAIYTEVNLIENYDKTALYPELRDWLNGEGFEVELENIDSKDAGNVLFIKKE
jgi:FkbM family methyltransferase